MSVRRWRARRCSALPPTALPFAGGESHGCHAVRLHLQRRSLATGSSDGGGAHPPPILTPQGNTHVHRSHPHAFGGSDVEIEAVLMSTSVEGDELDRVVAQLAESDAIGQAFWSPSTTE